MAANYRVLWTSAARQSLVAKSANTSPELRLRLSEVLRQFEADFANDPSSVGEVYRTTGPISEHLAVRDIVALDFAIDQLRRFVLVRKARFLSGPGSGDDD